MRSAIEEAGATLATHENWRSAVEEAEATPAPYENWRSAVEGAEATLGQKLGIRGQTSKPRVDDLIG